MLKEGDKNKVVAHTEDDYYRMIMAKWPAFHITKLVMTTFIHR